MYYLVHRIIAGQSVRLGQQQSANISIGHINAHNKIGIVCLDGKHTQKQTKIAKKSVYGKHLVKSEL